MNGKEEISYPLYFKGGRGSMPTYRCKIPPTPEGVSVRTLLHLGSFFWECPHPWALVLDSKENEKKIP